MVPPAGLEPATPIVKPPLTRFVRLLIVCPRDISVANQRSFGRRIDAQQIPGLTRKKTEAAVPIARGEISEAPTSQSPPPLIEIGSPSVDDELQEWKQARKMDFMFLWRPLSWMASLCFGIASFVLPDSVNSAVQWLLYALMAASLYAGFAKRRKAKN
jgi:hypothetical protein